MEVSEAEEMERLRFGLDVVRRELPYSVISVDTFRPDVARMAVEEFGADIINDVSEGSEEMYRMVSRLRVPYILMSQQPTIKKMLLSFATQVQQLRDLGVKDIILDREDAGTELRGHGRTREVTGHGTAIARRNLPKVDDL